MGSLIIGGLQGFIATIPMTLAMHPLKNLLLGPLFPLPPLQVSMNILRKLSLRDSLRKKEKIFFFYLSHFGFGTFVGSIFFKKADQWKGNFILKATGYCLLVWGGTYASSLPASGLIGSFKRAPARRNILMLVSHLVWGGTLGLLAQGIYSTRQERGKVVSENPTGVLEITVRDPRI